MAERQFVSLKLGGRLLGIDILLVREIIREFDFTPVEHPLVAVLGLLNLRGQIITVVDPSRVLGMPAREISTGSRCVILKTDTELSHLAVHPGQGEGLGPDAVGLVVDGISDVVLVDEAEVEKPPANAKGVDGKYLEGVVKLEDNLLLVLSVGGLLSGAGELMETLVPGDRDSRLVTQ